VPNTDLSDRQRWANRCDETTTNTGRNQPGHASLRGPYPYGYCLDGINGGSRIITGAEGCQPRFRIFPWLSVPLPARKLRERGHVNSNNQDARGQTTITSTLEDRHGGLVALLQWGGMQPLWGFDALERICTPSDLKNNRGIASHNIPTFTCSDTCLPASRGAWFRFKTLCCSSFPSNFVLFNHPASESWLVAIYVPLQTPWR